MFITSNEITKLVEYLDTAAAERPGTRISFDQIAHETGIPMDRQGRSWLRSATRRAKVEHAGIRGYGIEIAGPDNANEIMGGRLARLDNQTKRCERAAKNISDRYLRDMPMDEQRNLTMMISIFGAIRASAEQYRRIAKNQKQRIEATNTRL